MEKPALRRYTNLASAIHILQNRSLTLLDPNFWDDRNDAFYIKQFKERCAAKSVLALCFSEAPETYHHWRVFSHGTDGVSIKFDKAAIKEYARLHGKITARPVKYKEIKNINATAISDRDLPFLKRYPYRDEREYRLLYTDATEEKNTENLSIELSSIIRITLSPWMPIPLVESVKKSLKQIDGCGRIKIYRSTLIENEKWKEAALSK